MTHSTVKRDFALLIETACSNFEALSDLITGEAKITYTTPSPNPYVDMRHLKCSSEARAALAKQFVFNCVRAYRICEHGNNELGLDKAQRKAFIAKVKPVVPVRDVNEHGYDVNTRGKESRPSMHTHESGWLQLDETAMIIRGATEILMGPLNLHDIYKSIEKMRSIAGFASTRPITFDNETEVL